MSWVGYFVYNGIEIINASRTEKYAQSAGLGFFKAVYKNEALPLILGETYASPLQDDAPWTDPDHGESYEFYGLYPIDVSGIEDSTATVTVTESTRDGGWATPSRRATRSIVFSGALIAESDCAVEYGMRWLRAALGGGACIGGQRVHMNECEAHTLEFLSCEPKVDLTYSQGIKTVTRDNVDGLTPTAPGATPVDGLTPSRGGGISVDGGTPDILPVQSFVTAPVFDLTTCLPDYQRFFFDVSIVAGPTVTQKMVTSSGQVVWTVEFTATAANPFEYGPELAIVSGFGDPTVVNPYVGEWTGVWDPNGYVTQDPACPVTTFQPVTDPDCVLLIAPPAVPNVQTACTDWPDNYTRRMFTIPKEEVPEWTLVVPTFTITTVKAVSNIRVQFYADVDDDATPDDLCNPVSDLLFSYIPPSSTLTLDGVGHAVYVDTSGMPRRRGDAIMSSTDGGPITWPVLTCGHQIVVTVDTEQTANPPIVDLSLTAMAG